MSNVSVLVIGEALIDRVATARGIRPQTVDHVGGSPANVSLGLARLGLSVELLAWLARDEPGLRVESVLKRAGVGIREQSWGAQSTSVAHGALDESGSASYRFDLTWDVGEDATIGDVQLVHTGSIASYLPPGADRVRRLISKARDEGALVSYDPNVRVDLIDDPERVRRQILACIAAADVVKLSEDDAGWMYGAHVGADAVLDDVLASGTSLAVITTGEHGSILATPHARVLVPSEPVVVVDTIGAGDSYMAALIAQVVRQRHPLPELSPGEIAEIGAFCAHIAAITVSRPGADPPKLAEL